MTSEATRTARPAIETPGGRFEFAEHNCFACGTLNAGGLGLALHVEAGRSWADVTLDRRFEGWENVIHGGILCTILDEVMAWALVGEDNWGVTARMAVDFRRPVEVGLPIHAEGWITRSRRRVVDTAGHLVDVRTGLELATATGVYVAAGAQRKQDLQRRYAYRPTGAGPTTPDPVEPAEPAAPVVLDASAAGAGR
ncbi:MAG: PaaI family thioesterase [Acidimicrobiales bacterium]